MGTNFESMGTGPFPPKINDFEPENTLENKVLSKKNEILGTIGRMKEISSQFVIFQSLVKDRRLPDKK